MFGTQGSAEALEQTKLVLRRTAAPPQHLRFEPFEALRYELEAFADAAVGSAAYPIPLEQMLADVAALKAAVKSIETGTPVLVTGGR